MAFSPHNPKRSDSSYILQAEAYLVCGASLVGWLIAHKGEFLGMFTKMSNQQKAFQKYIGDFKGGVAFRLCDPWTV